MQVAYVDCKLWPTLCKSIDGNTNNRNFQITPPHTHTRARARYMHTHRQCTYIHIVINLKTYQVMNITSNDSILQQANGSDLMNIIHDDDTMNRFPRHFMQDVMEMKDNPEGDMCSLLFIQSPHPGFYTTIQIPCGATFMHTKYWTYSILKICEANERQHFSAIISHIANDSLP